jgi:hypothetical protein
VIALVLMARRSARAPLAVAAMNGLGLLGILVSESWLSALQLQGEPMGAALHGPTVGAALYTVLHALAFHYARAAGARLRLPSTSPAASGPAAAR